MATSARVLSEADILESEIERRRADLSRLEQRLAVLRNDSPVLRGATEAPTNGEIVPLAEIERRYILQVLAKLGGNRTHTARALQIGTNTLWRKLKAWGVQSG